MKAPQVLVLVSLAVATTVAVEEYRISELREQLASRGGAEAIISSSTVSAAGGGDVAAPSKTKSSSDERPAPPVITPPVIEPPILGKSFASNARKMWDNPAAKSMMSQGAKVAVAMMYQDFLDGMKLSKEEGDYFKDLLAREVSDQQELGMKMMEATPEERKALAEDLKKRGEQTQQDIKKFLNNEDDYKAYSAYKNRIPERQQLDGIRTAMAAKGAPLDQGVEAKLVDVMYRARTEADSPELTGPAAIENLASGDLVGNFEKTWDAQQEFLTLETKGLLTGEQAAAFQEYRQQMKEMQLMQIKMAEQMMSDKKDAAE
ncbi:MAG: hypothetical protein V4640_13635 [Verrucomicrobiota bacterium]